MANRARNLWVLGLVAVLLVGAALVVVPHSPASKPTRLGLDLRGGIELIYQGEPTPQVPKVTSQAIQDAINTIQKRTNALGVSEPEIQSAGQNEISVGLPAVQNAQRAEQEVGTTAQLQFYDWQNSTLGPKDPYGNPTKEFFGIFQAVQFASKQHDIPQPTDIPPGAPTKQVRARFGGNQQAIERYYDTQNDTSGNKYYLFGPGTAISRQIIHPGQVSTGSKVQEFANSNDATAYYENCSEIAQDYESAAPATRTTRTTNSGLPAKGTACASTMARLAQEGIGPPKGSLVVEVPEGVVVIKAQEPESNPNAKVNQYYVLQDDSELSGTDITSPKAETDPQTGEPVVTFGFTGKGQARFAAVTKRLAARGASIILPPGTPKQNSFQDFAITLDGQVVSLASINYIQYPQGIDGSNGTEITGIGSIDATNQLAQELQIGALPINLKLISKTQVSATLGQQALNQGLVAGAVGLALTLLFLLLFYRVLGVVAGVALVIYAVFLFALVKLIPITLTLPGIAGLILTLGVAADANIVIFERVKEEARTGLTIPRAIATGYAKALRAIVDANAVTFGVAFILFMLATSSIKGFAFTLGVGTLVSLFTAVVATHAILGSMGRTRLLRSRFALNLGRRTGRVRFDFMGNARWFFSMSGTIIAAGAIAIATLGINFGIDFTAGTRITVPLSRPASVAQVQSSLSPLGYGKAQVQKVTDPQIGRNVVQISVKKLAPDKVNQVENRLDQTIGVNRAEFSVTSVGPTFGQQIAKTAALAIIASLILISIYIGLRFEFKFAVPVLIALAHDLLITSGVYALTSRQVTTSTVAALLTILGYSLYDTIIVFDRIRENVPRMPRATFSQIVNRSMSEVLTRSLATSFSTLIPIAALMLFGGSTLKDFGFALLVGVASGAYSSIFIASPVLTHWKEREPVWVRRRRLVMQDHDGVVPAYADVALGADQEPEERRPLVGAGAGTRTARTRRERRAGGPAVAASAVEERPAPETDGGGGVPIEPPPDGDGRASDGADGGSHVSSTQPAPADREAGPVDREEAKRQRAERIKARQAARRRKRHGRPR